MVCLEWQANLFVSHSDDFVLKQDCFGNMENSCCVVFCYTLGWQYITGFDSMKRCVFLSLQTGWWTKQRSGNGAAFWSRKTRSATKLEIRRPRHSKQNRFQSSLLTNVSCEMMDWLCCLPVVKHNVWTMTATKVRKGWRLQVRPWWVVVMTKVRGDADARAKETTKASITTVSSAFVDLPTTKQYPFSLLFV